MTAQEYFDSHGISKTSIEKFGITFDKKKITIPIKDGEGNVLFNKYRHLDFDKEDPSSKKFSYDEGSHAQLFNTAVLDSSPYIFITEGEFDCIRLDQEGLAAVTNTSGASTFKEEWIEQIKDKKIYIVYDNDKAGKEGAEKLLEMLPSAVSITLPLGSKDICEYFQTHSKEEFRSLVDEQVKEQGISFQQLCDLFDKYLLLPDKNVIRVLLAGLISHFFASDPLWIFFVAPPSGSKTEIISTASALPFVEMLSDLTTQTFISGMIGSKDASLLTRLKNNVLIMKDFTTVLAMRQEERGVILGQLREIYDGRYSKAFGTGKTIEWEGRITLLAGVTTIIDTHSSVSQAMGERFIMYRIPQSLDVDVAKKALHAYGAEKKMREELRNAMRKYFFSLTIPKIEEIALPEEILDAIANLASFIVKARTALIRDFRRELIYIPVPEAPARLAKQLGTMVKAMAVEFNRNTVTWDDYYLTLKCALDVIPNNRTRHLTALCGRKGTIDTTQIAQATEYSRSGSELILEDLTALRLVEVTRGGSGTANQWILSPSTKEYFRNILPKGGEGLDLVFPEGSELKPLISEMLRVGGDSDFDAQETWQESLEESQDQD